VFANGVLWRTVAFSLSPNDRVRLKGARLAGPISGTRRRPDPGTPAGLLPRQRGVIGQRINVGFHHTGTTVTIDVDDEIPILHKQITTVLTAYAPKLLGCYGVGPDTAAALLITAGDNPTRMHSEASFAALCGVSPIEASSGKTQRRRLNRGGDRRANSALYTIALSRLRWNTCTSRTGSSRGQVVGAASAPYRG
jgi:transposase IS116/IS110/IS902 family protein